MKKVAILTVLAVTAVSFAAIFNEVEPNDTKAQATPAFGLVNGDQLTGTSTSSTGAGLDYWLLSTAPAPLGIYRHRLLVTPNNLAWTASIRGLGQTAAAVDTAPGIPWDGVVGVPNATEATVQSISSATNPPRFQQWYGFGKAEQLHWRINGSTATTVPYVVDYVVEPVTPVDIGSFQPGVITITTFGQGHSTDTDLWVYDSNFNAIVGYGNDDEAPNAISGGPGTGTTLQSWLARTYAPGVYYLALTNFNLANNQPSPSDDDFRTGSILEFPDAVLNSSTTTNLNMAFSINDLGRSIQIPNTKVGAFDINWFKFTVVPEPTSLVLLALGALLRRR